MEVCAPDCLILDTVHLGNRFEVGYIPEYHRDPCLRYKHRGGSGDMFKEGR